jgi:hypothetical protein
MNKHYIYFHKRADDGVIFYVGIGVGRRATAVKNRSDFWKRIVAKHGYIIEYPHKDISQEEAKQLEIHYISVFGRIDRGTGTLCNMTDGGDGRVGYECSEETKEKMRKAATGVKFTEERKRKIGEKSRERKAWLSAQKAPWTKERKEKLRMSRKDRISVICDNVLYASQSQAGKHYGFGATEIRRRCLSDKYPNFRFA